MVLERFLCKTHRLQGITTIVWIVVMLLLCNTSCNKEKKEVVDVSFDPETTYTLRTTDVSTLISDSGITRYRLNAIEGLVFGTAKDPYWYFTKCIYVEKFDTLFQSEASIQADTAYNYEKKSLWKLVGNVKIESLEGTRFETSLLYWDQKEEKIYSDKYIRIEEEDKVITGIGFESNQDMSQYKIFDSQGVFPVSESANDTISETVSLDSVTVQKEEFVPEYESDIKQEIVKKNERKLVPKILKPLEKEIR